MKRRDAETRKKNGALHCDSASLHALYARDRLVFHSPRLCASAFHSMLGHARRPPFLRAMRILLSLLLLASALTAAEIRTVAITGTAGSAGDGAPAKDATLSGPKGISVAPNGNVYVADTESHSVRTIDKNGRSRTRRRHRRKRRRPTAGRRGRRRRPAEIQDGPPARSHRGQGRQRLHRRQRSAPRSGGEIVTGTRGYSRDLPFPPPRTRAMSQPCRNSRSSATMVHRSIMN